MHLTSQKSQFASLEWIPFLQRLGLKVTSSKENLEECAAGLHSQIQKLDEGSDDYLDLVNEFRQRSTILVKEVVANNVTSKRLKRIFLFSLFLFFL